eukprot:185069-Chlamydomonas_euryale.AAC.1
MHAAAAPSAAPASSRPARRPAGSPSRGPSERRRTARSTRRSRGPVTPSLLHTGRGGGAAAMRGWQCSRAGHAGTCKGGNAAGGRRGEAG